MSILACQPYVNPRITLVLGLNDRTPTTVVRVSPLRKARRRCQNGRPSSINTAHPTPAALPSRAPRNAATDKLSVSGQRPSFVGVPLARGARILNFLDRGTHLMKKARIATVSLPSLVKSPEKASKWVPWGTAICLGHGLKEEL